MGTYLKKLNPSFTTSNTVLLSNLEGFSFPQLLIPPSVISSLNTVTMCYAQSDQAGMDLLESAYGSADYYSYNALGSAT
jgi:hypothetical protein